jgi:hypothetical protein
LVAVFSMGLSPWSQGRWGELFALLMKLLAKELAK